MKLNIQYVNTMGDQNIEIAILGFLIDNPKHGYELFKELKNPNGIGEVYRIKIGKMYSILKKFEEKELIFAKTIHVGNRPPKNLYRITKIGKTAFSNWMVKPIVRGRDFRIIFLLKLFFLINRSEFNEIDLISNQKNECKEWAKRINISNKQINEITSFNRIVKQYRLSQIDGYIKWLNWCERIINEKNDI
jgi:PadR family transcriptional regulator, regulatory protein AphA